MKTTREQRIAIVKDVMDTRPTVEQITHEQAIALWFVAALSSIWVVVLLIAIFGKSVNHHKPKGEQ